MSQDQSPSQNSDQGPIILTTSNATSISYVFFDCDGVLVDSEIIANRIVHQAMTALGLEISFPDYVRQYAGMKDELIVAQVCKQLGVSVGPDYVDVLNQTIDSAFLQDLKVIEGAKQTVLSVPLPKAVVSNSPIERVQHSLGLCGITDVFGPHIFTADMAGVAKPDPKIYLFAAEKVGVDPQRVVVVEDSPTGVTAAAKAGMYVIGFCGASHIQEGHEALLMARGASFVCHTMEEVLEHLLVKMGSKLRL